jgi:acetyl-CoA synthetase
METRLDPTPHLERFESYENACREFRWQIPEHFNIASALCRRHDDAVTRIALSEGREGGVNTYTFGGLDFLSDKFATTLSESGITHGDSVAVVVRPSAALAIAHFGALKLGAVVVPLSLSSSAALLEHTIADCAAGAVVFDESVSDLVADIARRTPTVKARFVVKNLRPARTSPGLKDFWTEVDRSSSDFETVEGNAKSAAFIFYVESQGEIIGVVHSHRSVIGQLAAFEVFNEIVGERENVFWVAADWCAPGAALGVLYPAWWYGCSVVAGATEDVGDVLRLLEQCGVTNVFKPASATNEFFEAEPQADEGAGLRIRTVVTEAIKPNEYLVSSNPSVTINEVFGKPETGWIAGKCERLFATTPGSVGRSVPGRIIEIIDETGKALPPRQVGHIAIHNSDSALFTRYQLATSRTEASFAGDWFLTGDVGYKNGDGELFISPSQSVVGTS